MKPLFIHNFNTAFYLWVNHQILKKFEAYNVVSNETLYKSSDQKISGYFAYSSRFKPWVADQSIATIPSGIVSGSTFIPKSSGLYFDYQNGRVLSPINFGQTIKANFTYSDIGVYPSNHTEEQAILENRYLPNARFAEITGTGVPAYDYLTPCVLLSVDSYENSPLSFGGEDCTEVYAKAIIICDNDTHLMGIQSVLTDSVQEVFPAITSTDMPFNAFWDTTGAYNYDNYKQKYGEMNFLIEEAKASRISNGARSQVPLHLAIGFVDFKITQYRYPRQ